MLNFPFALQSMFACFSFVYDFDYNAILVFCIPIADKYDTVCTVRKVLQNMVQTN